MNTSKPLSALVWIVAFLLFIPLTGHCAPLDGTTWKITVTPDESAMKHGEKPFLDTLIFIDGRMTSGAAFRNGFPSAPYTAAAQNGGVTFTAEHKSPKGGQAKWSAEARRGIIHGKIFVERLNGVKLSYTFTGALPTKKKK